MSGNKPDGVLTLQTIAMPADANSNGDIFGGWLMSQMDLGASVLARARAKGRVATIAVDGMTFHRPVAIGDVVSIHARMLKEGTTSMQIGIEAWRLGQPENVPAKVTQAIFVFVAVDETGVKRPLPAAEA